ncbi:Na+/H+ antiporter NhaC family protein [Maricurvus nonylphenolicus]|uniref:Na+/H+ antiporter NhaC family protein n=1 Tax=Maricurvus nonylphenolicus TaxID=1008307 RepID=UPI0036F2D777
MEYYGFYSFIPALLVVITAVITRRPIESLLMGTIVGLLMLSPADAITNFADLSQKILMSETVAWVIVVCGLMGSLIVLFLRTGTAVAFSNMVAKRAKSRTSALLSTWFLGLVIFIDDYLNALAVSSSMKGLTDKHRVSREMLSYVVDSTAAPICILIPISTWAVFCSGVLESSGVAPAGEGMSLYISAIPYMLYAWIAAIMVPLVAMGKLPLLGSMKQAEARAANGEICIVEADCGHGAGSHGGEDPAALAGEYNPGMLGVWNFIVPMVSLLFFTWLYDINVLIGVFFAVVITVLLFGFQKLMPWNDLCDGVLDGIKLMIPALAIVIIAFMFKDVNDQLGLSEYVIEVVKPIMSPKLLPMITFITMGLLAFATGSFWGVFAIATPIIVPLAISVGTPIPLVLGALMSASAFGSHACFYSDSTVLAAQGSGCPVMSHALTQLPYVLIAAVLSTIGLTLLAL